MGLNRYLRHGWSVVCASFILAPALAVAQGAGPENGGLEEVTVTARKTTENLQVVPIAVSAFSAESLESKGLSNLAQIGDYTPNVTLDFTAPISGASSALVAFIRGIGQSDFAINFEPGVGVYVDGVYYARTLGSVIDLLDLERIEVLKGPQGTLFGRNTIGGAINVVTRPPSERFGGKAEMTVGSYDRRDVRASVDLPLSDSVRTSFAFSSKNRDGYVHRIPYPGWDNREPSDLRYDAGLLSGLPNGNDLGNENNDTLRAKLLWLIDDSKTFLLSGDYVRVRENSAPTTLVRTFPAGPDGIPGTADDALSSLYNACAAGVGPPICHNVAGVGDLTGRTPYGNAFQTGNPFTTYGNGLSGTDLDDWGLAAIFSWALSDTTSFKSITAYRQLDSAFGEDADESPIVIDHHGFAMDQHQFTEELQLVGNSERLTWQTGLYYFREQGGIHDLVPLGGGLLQVDGPNSLRNRSAAAYGQLTWHVTAPWSVTFGARYTDEDKRFSGGQRDRDALAFNLGLPLALHPVPSDPTIYFPPGELQQSFSNTSIRVGTELRFTDDIFGYVSYAQGFKSGGWDTRLTAPVLVVPPFREEKADTVEVGIKSELAQRRVRLNGAAFFTKYDDLQLIIQRGISPLTTNAGKSEIKGVELEFQWAATEALRLSGSYGWIDAKYTQLDAAANASGIFLTNKFNNTPENSLSLALDYSRPATAGATVDWHLDYVWKDDTFNDAVNTPELMQKAFGLLDASVTWHSAEDKWSLSVGGQNLTDEEYILSGFNQPGIGYIIATRGIPRTWFAKLALKF